MLLFPTLSGEKSNGMVFFVDGFGCYDSLKALCSWHPQQKFIDFKIF